MAGKRTSGGPLPDGHPFKGGLILFGSSIPEAWKEGFRKKAQGLNPVQPSKSEKEQPSSLEPDDLEAQAFNDYEEALTRSIQEKVRDKE